MNKMLLGSERINKIFQIRMKKSVLEDGTAMMPRFYVQKAERGARLPYCALRRRACHGVEAQMLICCDWVEDSACSYYCRFGTPITSFLLHSTDLG
jgi:hypothetical protein